MYVPYYSFLSFFSSSLSLYSASPSLLSITNLWVQGRVTTTPTEEGLHLISSADAIEMRDEDEGDEVPRNRYIVIKYVRDWEKGVDLSREVSPLSPLSPHPLKFLFPRTSPLPYLLFLSSFFSSFFCRSFH